MDTEFKSDPSATTFDMSPSNAFEIRASKRRAGSRKLLTVACLLLAGGVGSYLWFMTRDSKYMYDGVVTQGIITSIQSQTRTTKQGRTITTHTINYNYESDTNTQHSGWDTIQSWRDVPKSQSALHPQSDQPIDVEYLKSNPQTSRIVVLNRYRAEYAMSITTMVVAMACLVIQFLNMLPSRLRAKGLGTFLILAGLATAFSAIHVPLLVITFPFLIIPVAYGFFLLARCRHSFQDLLELQRLESLPPLGDRASVLLSQFYGVDASLILDHQKRQIHFINCHVTNGFNSKLLDVYSCDIDSLDVSQKTVATKHGKIMQAILQSKDGATTLELQNPGVNEFLAQIALTQKNRNKKQK